MSARNQSIAFQSSMDATSLICNLPEDLMTKILLRLPVKSVLRFKAVSKSWYAFLTSFTFTSLYLREPIIAHKLLKVCYTNPISFIPKISLIVLSDNNGFRASDVYLPFPINPNDELMVEDSCNGLVCLTMNSQSNIILWNPITRKYRFIELPSCQSFEDRLASVGRGFVPGSNDYKIVRIPFHHAKATVFWVYTLSSDSWKKLEVSLPFVPLRYRQPTFVCGRMHWITLEDMKVMRIARFELNNEVLQVMEVPDSHGFHTGIKRKLLIINDCLSMIVSLELEVTNSSFEIWMMAEYGIQESWTKLFTVGTLPMARARQPLASLQDGKLLFQYSTESSEQMLLYDHVTKRIKFLPDSGSFVFHVFNYVESLESVGKSRRRAKDFLQRS